MKHSKTVAAAEPPAQRTHRQSRPGPPPLRGGGGSAAHNTPSELRRPGEHMAAAAGRRAACARPRSLSSALRPPAAPSHRPALPPFLLPPARRLTRRAVGAGEEELQRQLGSGHSGQLRGGLVQELVPGGSAHLQACGAEPEQSGCWRVLPCAASGAGGCVGTAAAAAGRVLGHSKQATGGAGRDPSPAIKWLRRCHPGAHLGRAARRLGRRHCPHRLQRRKGQRRQRVPRALRATQQEVALQGGAGGGGAAEGRGWHGRPHSRPCTQRGG